MGNAKYKQKHKELGLCCDCSEPVAIAGYCLKHYWNKVLRIRHYSQDHSLEARERARRWRHKMEDESRCNHCGCPLIEGEGKRCVNCATIKIRHAV